MNRLRTVLHGLTSLAGLAVLLAGVPWALLRRGRLPEIRFDGWWMQLTDSVVSDSTVFVVFTVAAWFAWAIFAASVIVETVAGLRGVGAPRITGAGPLQLLARSLVVPILLLVSLTQHPPTAAHTTTVETPSPTPIDTVTVIAAAPPSAPTGHLRSTSSDPPPTADPSAAAVPDGDVRIVVVERNDNPWKLAEEHLGDGLRWRELFDANRGLTQPDGRAWTDPEVILPGWQVRLPTHAVASAEAGSRIHEVERGDTLSDLADRYLGDPDRYMELFEANRHLDQPDGRHLTDPDLIVVGWHLTIPAEPVGNRTPIPSDDPDPPPSPEAPDDAGETPTDPPDATTLPIEPTETPPADPPGEQPAQPAPMTPARPQTPNGYAPAPTDPSPAQSVDTSADEASRLPVLAGLAGAVALATGLALRMRWLRRRRATRDPRQRDLPPTPTEQVLGAIADEPLVRWAGQCLAGALRGLDRRSVSAAPVAVELCEESGIELLWDAPQHADPPAGWTTADGGWAWRCPYDPEAAVPNDELPPAIPALVTIGHRDGRQLLVDLEAFGTLTIDGPDTPNRALATAIAVELACGNDFADAYVTTVGFDLDSGIAHRHRLSVADAATAAAQLQSARRSVDEVLAHDRSADTFQARIGNSPPIEATVAVARSLTPTDLDTLATATAPRRGTAVVACGSPPVPTGAHIEIHPTGHTARLEPLGITFQPTSLDEEAVAEIAATINALSTLPADEPSTPETPPSSSSDQSPSDAARPTIGHPVASNGQRLDTATPGEGTGPSPTGNEDLPVAVESGRLFDPVATGTDEAPMIVRVLGVPRIDERPEMRRRELILAALLACRGGTLAASAAQDALWGGKPIEAKTMWNFVAKVRRSLGDLDDGSPAMPAADRTRGQLRLDPRIITDLSLLRQAAADAPNASSTEAITLLRDALSLVEGPPFDGPGYDWAHRDQDVAEAAVAIQQAVDQLVQLALDADQLEVAREAITRGLRGLPGDEHLYRIRMRVESVAGNHAGVVAAYDELVTYLADLETQPSPATTALYHELIGSGRPAGGALR